LAKTLWCYSTDGGWDMRLFLLAHIPFGNQKVTNLCGDDWVAPCPSLKQWESLRCHVGAVAIFIVILLQQVL